MAGLLGLSSENVFTAKFDRDPLYALQSLKSDLATRRHLFMPLHPSFILFLAISTSSSIIPSAFSCPESAIHIYIICTTWTFFTYTTTLLYIPHCNL